MRPRWKESVPCLCSVLASHSLLLLIFASPGGCSFGDVVILEPVLVSYGQVWFHGWLSQNLQLGLDPGPVLYAARGVSKAQVGPYLGQRREIPFLGTQHELVVTPQFGHPNVFIPSLRTLIHTPKLHAMDSTCQELCPAALKERGAYSLSPVIGMYAKLPRKTTSLLGTQAELTGLVFDLDVHDANYAAVMLSDELDAIAVVRRFGLV